MFERFKAERRRAKESTAARRSGVRASAAAVQPEPEPSDGGALSGVHARLTQLCEREDRTAKLVWRFEKESRIARSAVEAAAAAREERDEYRRVLAAAIASERRAEERLAALDEERLEAHARATEGAVLASRASAERDALAERVAALEALMRDQGARFERSLSDVQDRAWTEREAAHADLLRLANEARRGASEMASEVAREVREALAESAALREVAAITGLRRRLFVGLGIGAAVIGLALVPSAVLAAMDGERAMFVHLASGLGPWHLFATAVLAFAAAGALLTMARRDALSHA